MNILQELIKSQGGDVIGQLSKQFGVSASDAEKALSNLVPAVAGGIKKTAASQNGLEALLSKVKNNQELRRSANNPNVLERPEVAQAGNEVLGDIFGSKEVSRNVAGQTAKSTGLDAGMLKKMLPLVAGLVMSQLNNKSEASKGGLGELLGSVSGASKPAKKGGLGGLLGGLLGGNKRKQAQQSGGLGSLLDFDGDGNIADDVLDMAKKLF